MFEKYRIGIMGSGNIAGIMAETIKRMKNVKLYAVASRIKVKADAFANQYGCKKAYGSYEELVADKKTKRPFPAENGLRKRGKGLGEMRRL